MKKVFIFIVVSFFLANPLFALGNDFWNAIFLEATEGTDLTKHPMVKKFAKECFDKFS